MKIDKELVVTEQNNIDLTVERCVMCDAETKYTSQVPIIQRNYYVEETFIPHRSRFCLISHDS